MNKIGLLLLFIIILAALIAIGANYYSPNQANYRIEIDEEMYDSSKQEKTDSNLLLLSHFPFTDLFEGQLSLLFQYRQQCIHFKHSFHA